jgi:hypothetical protein
MAKKKRYGLREGSKEFNRKPNGDFSTKAPPQHNTKGTPCDIVAGCTSGKPALYVVAGKYACVEHRDVAYQQAKKHWQASPLPSVGQFEPEVETVEVEEVEVGRFVSVEYAQADVVD